MSNCLFLRELHYSFFFLFPRPTTMSKIEKEKRVVEMMIRIYCRHGEHNSQLCPSCVELLEYARQRLSRCPFGNEKKSCRKCPIHCYNPQMAARIRTVMKYSGPRMMLYYPHHALAHWLSELRK